MDEFEYQYATSHGPAARASPERRKPDRGCPVQEGASRRVPFYRVTVQSVTANVTQVDSPSPTTPTCHGFCHLARPWWARPWCADRALRSGTDVGSSQIGYYSAAMLVTSLLTDPRHVLLYMAAASSEKPNSTKSSRKRLRTLASC